MGLLSLFAWFKNNKKSFTNEQQQEIKKLLDQLQKKGEDDIDSAIRNTERKLLSIFVNCQNDRLWDGLLLFKEFRSNEFDRIAQEMEKIKKGDSYNGQKKSNDVGESFERCEKLMEFIKFLLAERRQWETQPNCSRNRHMYLPRSSTFFPSNPEVYGSSRQRIGLCSHDRSSSPCSDFDRRENFAGHSKSCRSLFDSSQNDRPNCLGPPPPYEQISCHGDDDCDFSSKTMVDGKKTARVEKMIADNVKMFFEKKNRQLQKTSDGDVSDIVSSRANNTAARKLIENIQDEVDHLKKSKISLFAGSSSIDPHECKYLRETLIENLQHLVIVEIEDDDELRVTQKNLVSLIQVMLDFLDDHFQ